MFRVMGLGFGINIAFFLTQGLSDVLCNCM